MKSASVLILLDCRHRLNALQMLQEEDGHAWTDGYLCVILIMHRDGAAILQAEAIRSAKSLAHQELS